MRAATMLVRDVATGFENLQEFYPYKCAKPEENDISAVCQAIKNYFEQYSKILEDFEFQDQLDLITLIITFITVR